jgi:hypothetical protein
MMTDQPRQNYFAAGLAISFFAVLALMVRWGGVPDVAEVNFWLGVVILGSTLAVFGGLCWWLFFSPVPSEVKPHSTQLSEGSYLMLLAALFAGFLSIIGVFWDETWHRLYGFAEVLNDFLWAPHKLLYVSLGALTLVAGMSLYQAIRANRSDVRVGFRTHPYLGMFGLIAAYLMFSLPSDQVWHLVYGLDITAWSLPHILLLTSFGFVMISLSAIFLSGERSSSLTFNALLGGLAMGIGGVMLLVLVTDYDSAAAPLTQVSANVMKALAERPQWTYPVAVVTLGVLLASVGVRLSGRFGVVTVAALTIIVFRSVMVTFFNASKEMGVVSHVLIVIPMVIIDAWQLLMRDKAKQPSSLFRVMGALVAAACFLVVGIPVINGWLATYHINNDAIPGAILVGAIMAVWANAIGDLFGGWLTSLDSGQLPTVSPSRLVRQFAISAVIAIAIFLVVFFTAQPPNV